MHSLFSHVYDMSMECRNTILQLGGYAVWDWALLQVVYSRKGILLGHSENSTEITQILAKQNLLDAETSERGILLV